MPRVEFEFTGDTSALKRALGEAEDGLDKTDKAAGKASKSTKKAGSSMKGAGISAKSLAKGLAPVAAAATAAAAAMYKAAAANSQFIDDMKLMSITTGVSADTLIALDVGARRLGSSSAELEMGLKSLVERFADASTKGGEAEEALLGMGLSQEQIRAGADDSEKALRLTLDAIAAMPPGAKKAAAALDAFGGRGAKIAAIFSDGSESLDRFAAEADAAGLAMTGNAIAASNAFDESLGSLDTTVRGLTNSLGAEATPSVVEFVDTLNAAIKIGAATFGWLKDITVAIDSLNPASVAVRKAFSFMSAEVRGSAPALRESAAAATETQLAMDALGESMIAAFDGANTSQREALVSQIELLEGFEAISDISEKETFALARARAELEALDKKERANIKTKKRVKKATEEITEVAVSSAAERVAAEIAAIEQIAENEDVLVSRRRAALASIRDDTMLDLSARAAAAAELTELLAAEEDKRAAKVAELRGQIQQERDDQRAEEDRARAADLAAEQSALEARKAAYQDLAKSAAAAVGEIASNAIAGQQAEVDAQISALESKKRLNKSERQMLKDLHERKKRLAKKSFFAQKASTISSIALSTALNVVSMNAPPPIGIGAPQGAIVALGLGLTQAAVAASTPAPKFADGGRVGRDSSLSPDQRPIIAEEGEMVLNPRAVQSVGEDVLDSINRQGGSSGQRRAPASGQAGIRTLQSMLIQALGGDDGLALRLQTIAPGMGGGFR